MYSKKLNRLSVNLLFLCEEEVESGIVCEEEVERRIKCYFSKYREMHSRFCSMIFIESYDYMFFSVTKIRQQEVLLCVV